MTVLLLGFQVSQAQVASYTLDEAIDFALENNQQSKIAQLEMDIADRQVGEILAIGLPQVNASAGLDYNYKIQQMILPGNAFDPNGDPNETIVQEFGIDYNSNFGFALSQMVFDGTFFIGLEAAKTFTQLSKKEYQRTNIDVAEAVSKAYFGVLVNRERYELIERNFQRVDTLLQDTEKMYQSGLAERIDVSRIKVQYNNLKVELDNYQKVVDVTESLLKFQMGIPLENTIELSDGIEDIGFFDFELVKDFSYNKRIEYQTLNVSDELNQLDIRQIRAQYYPSLYLTANYGKNWGATTIDGWISDEWFGAGAIGFRASMPIFDGLMKRRQVQQRQLKAMQIQNQFEMLEQSIDLEIQTSLANYEREIDRIRAQRENMELAEEVYNVTKIKFEEGVGSNIEVLDADASFKEAQVNFYNAIYDALISKVDLQKAYGVLR